MVFTKEEATLVKSALLAGLVELKAQNNFEALEQIEKDLIEANELDGIAYIEKLTSILEFIYQEIGGDALDR